MVKKISRRDHCHFCGHSNLYLAFDEHTWRVNEVCEKCAGIHYLCTIIPRNKEKEERKNNYEIC